MFGFQIEQAKYFGGGQAACCVFDISVAQHTLKYRSLVSQNGVDAFLDRIVTDKPSHDHGAGLSDSMCPVDGLILDRRVPPTIEQEDVTGKLKVQADGTRSIAHQQNVLGRILFELCKNWFPFLCWNSTVVDQRVELLQAFAEPVQDFCPLAEEDCFAAALCNFFHVGDEAVEFRTFVGQRVEICDLFQAKDQLKNVLDGNLVSHFVELNDALFLGHCVGVLLSGAQFEIRIPVQTRRHVLHGDVFGAAQDVLVGEL